MARSDSRHWVMWAANWAFTVGLMPYLAWIAAEAIWGQGQLVGPYLLASPLIAGVVVMLILIPGVYQERYQNKNVADPALQDRLDELGTRFGFKNLRGYFQPHQESEVLPDVVEGSGQNVYIFMCHWRFMDDEQRNYYLLHFFAWRATLARVNLIRRPVFFILLFLGYLAATQNLWWILPLHTSGAISLFFVTQWEMWYAQTHADRIALEETRRVDIAKERANLRRIPSPFDRWTNERRLELIEEHAKRLEIA